MNILKRWATAWDTPDPTPPSDVDTLRLQLAAQEARIAAAEHAISAGYVSLLVSSVDTRVSYYLACDMLADVRLALRGEASVKRSGT